MIFKSKKASSEEISKPPIGGITPLKMFKYGSVIEESADNMPLLQSILGNQVNRTLISNKNEQILNVSLRTPEINFIVDMSIRLY